MYVLGIESTCDETAAAIVEDGRKVISNVISTSVKEQALYGGVDFRKPVEYGLKGPPVIVVVKSYHFKYLLVIPQPAASPYRILSREFIIQSFMLL